MAELPSDDVVFAADRSNLLLELDGERPLKILQPGEAEETPDEAAAEGVDVCRLGSPRHIQALKAKLAEVKRQQDNAAKEKRLAEARAEELQMTMDAVNSQLLSLQRVDTGSTTLHTAAVHHSVRTFGDAKIEAIPSTERGFRVLQPIVRQYFVDRETLVREEEERKTSWAELFFDLAFVTAISQVGHVYANSLSLGNFIFLFTPLWKTWYDMMSFLNVFGSDDTVQRIFVYWTMLLAVTLAISSSTAIPANGEFGGTMSLFYGVFLVSRTTFIAMYSSLGFFFPAFKFPIVMVIFQQLLPSILWLAGLLAAPSSAATRTALWALAVCAEYGALWTAVLVGRFGGRLGLSGLYPRFAVNLEHVTERMGLFVILALGEGIVSIVAPAPTPYLSDPFYGKAALGLLASMALMYQYFSNEQAQHRRHAMRRSATTGLFWNFLHYPLVQAIIVAASSLSVIMQGNDPAIKAADSPESTPLSHAKRAEASVGRAVESGVIWSYTGGLAVALCCVATMMCMHNHDDSQWRFSLRARVALKYLSAVGICLVGLGHESLPLKGTLGIVAAILLALALVDAYSRRDISPEFCAEDFGNRELVSLGKPVARRLWSKAQIRATEKAADESTAHG